MLLQAPETIDLSPEIVARALDYTIGSTPTLKAVKDAIEKSFFGGRSVLLDQFTNQAQYAIQAGLLEVLDAWKTTDPLTVHVRKPKKFSSARSS